MLGDYLKKYRLKKLLTKTELAEKIGISVSYLSLIENNKVKPGIKTVRKISEILEVNISYLRRLLNENNK